ncbi:hypothetical protein FNV43_RR00020 [Rhamnella rubrinervis]|uniref:Uncharacterized protein n=1 Tax=Rhamnella rubrinervis TaxID=2594499 RepID=A0A8K0HMU3_9ROSA|nr:hypothetical protein FNV43_RR00020 [Rhamnella rubrinervis]
MVIHSHTIKGLRVSYGRMKRGIRVNSKLHSTALWQCRLREAKQSTWKTTSLASPRSSPTSSLPSSAQASLAFLTPSREPNDSSSPKRTR